ncbi:uncharacterized protein LOC142985279 isoform X2 [Anticarsia gemmatalis]|uniref:uncharacterized protein LOC142985279 isoform X2 n=2 Tax=Anticarsia gemmatalis TaxID=129554 RepID=UPI003F7727E1
MAPAKKKVNKEKSSQPVKRGRPKKKQTKRKQLKDQKLDKQKEQSPNTKQNKRNQQSKRKEQLPNKEKTQYKRKELQEKQTELEPEPEQFEEEPSARRRSTLRSSRIRVDSPEPPTPTPTPTASVKQAKKITSSKIWAKIVKPKKDEAKATKKPAEKKNAPKPKKARKRYGKKRQKKSAAKGKKKTAPKKTANKRRISDDVVEITTPPDKRRRISEDFILIAEDTDSSSNLHTDRGSTPYMSSSTDTPFVTNMQYMPNMSNMPNTPNMPMPNFPSMMNQIMTDISHMIDMPPAAIFSGLMHTVNLMTNNTAMPTVFVQSDEEDMPQYAQLVGRSNRHVTGRPVSTTSSAPNAANSRPVKNQLPESKIIIANVHRYLSEEYERLKVISPSEVLSSLSDVTVRAARATGLSDQTLAQILAEKSNNMALAPKRTQKVRPQTSNEEPSYYLVADDHGNIIVE